MTGDYIGAAVFVELADAGAKYDGTGQRCPTAHTVDNGGTGKVNEA